MARRRKGGGRRRSRKGGSGWGALLLAVLVIGAGGFWLWRAGPGSEGKEAPAPAVEPPASSPEETAPAEPTPEPVDRRFEFYDLLPDAEVVVPEPSRPRPAPGVPPLSVPGAYVIQAGAFPAFKEADAVKARLALLGVQADIQKVTVDDRTFHRVRIGPIENLDELNRLRARLRQNNIDFLVIQVSE